MAYKQVTITLPDGRDIKVIDHRFTAKKWSEGQLFGATSKSDGINNTNIMIESYRDSKVEVLWNDSSLISYHENGWYIPSLNDLLEILKQKNKFNDLNCSDCFWSSTEDSEVGSWRVYFKNKSDKGVILNKNFEYHFCLIKEA